MPYISVNPATGKVLKTITSWTSKELATALEQANVAQQAWRAMDIKRRAELINAVAAHLFGDDRDRYAALITEEMGKVGPEAQGEIEKCALACDYYALNGPPFLQDEPVESDAGKSYVAYAPLGTLLAIMPWNFPFWQLFRAAIPALIAGNAVVFKHASNVPQCSLAIEEIFKRCGFPENSVRALFIEHDQVEDAIASPYVHAVTLTGSETAGRCIAALAGQHLKKCVLELGGSDPFIVLKDADIEFTVHSAVMSRFQNSGQSCIAAKRFILVPEIADEFIRRFSEAVESLILGDPADDDTTIGPMARADLRDELHRQVSDSIAQGAVPLLGCKPAQAEGFFYHPSILDRVTEKMRAYHEELFGPVAVIIRAKDVEDAMRIANDTRFGLGASIWSRDHARAEELIQQLNAGSTFINGMVRSDPRLPFGGVKASGFGRELSYHGLREFVNAKTVWIRRVRARADRERRNE